MKAQWCWALLATLWLSGCRSHSVSLPVNAPLIGQASLVGQDNQSSYGIVVPVCNRGPETMKAKVFIGGARSEVAGTPTVSELSAGAGTWMWMGLGQITEKRTRPVYIRIEWRRGQETGTKRFVITPQQTNIIKVK